MASPNDVINTLLKVYTKGYQEITHAPQYMPAHVGPVSGHTHPIYAKPTAKTTFAESYSTAFDVGIEMKDRLIDNVHDGLKALEKPFESNRGMTFPSRMARGWLASTAYIKPRAAEHKPPLPHHHERWGNDLIGDLLL